MSSFLNELVSLIKNKAVNRLALIISAKDLNLNSTDENEVYVLEISASNAAGGRGAGYGSREISKIHCFVSKDGTWKKKSEISGEALLEGFTPPHYVSLLPLTLDDGSEVVVYGVVDFSLISEYNQRFGLIA